MNHESLYSATAQEAYEDIIDALNRASDIVVVSARDGSRVMFLHTDFLDRFAYGDDVTIASHRLCPDTGSPGLPHIAPRNGEWCFHSATADHRSGDPFWRWFMLDERVSIPDIEADYRHACDYRPKRKLTFTTF